ncbi:MAG: hypothetical protein ACP5N3_05455 [Candidatus Nanoarchaeia archaeon]
MGKQLKVTLELEKAVDLEFTQEIIINDDNKEPFFFNDDYLFAHDARGQVMIFELGNLEKIGALEFGKNNINELFADSKFLYVHIDNIVPQNSNFIDNAWMKNQRIERSIGDLRVPVWYKKGDIVEVKQIEIDRLKFEMAETPLSVAGFKWKDLQKNEFEPLYSSSLNTLSSALVPVDLYRFHNMFFNNRGHKIHITDPYFTYYTDIMLFPEDVTSNMLRFRPILDNIQVYYQRSASDPDPTLEMVIKDNEIYSFKQFKELGLQEIFEKELTVLNAKRKNSLRIFEQTKSGRYLLAKSGIIKGDIEVDSSYEDCVSPGILGYHQKGDTFYILTRTWVYGQDIEPSTIVESPNKLLKFKITTKNPELQKLLNYK